MSPLALLRDMVILFVAIGATAVMLTMDRDKDTEGAWFQRATPWYLISGGSVFLLKFTTLYANFGWLSILAYAAALPLHVAVKKLRKRVAEYRAQDLADGPGDALDPQDPTLLAQGGRDEGVDRDEGDD